VLHVGGACRQSIQTEHARGACSPSRHDQPFSLFEWHAGWTVAVGGAGATSGGSPFAAKAEPHTQTCSVRDKPVCSSRLGLASRLCTGALVSGIG
jgi:hypothetical protein